MKRQYYVDWTIMNAPVIRECHESDRAGKSFKKTKKELLTKIKQKRKHWKKMHKDVKAATKPNYPKVVEEQPVTAE